MASAAYSAGRLRTAAHITPQPTVDLALLSGSLLHLDLCINVPLTLHPLFFPFSSLLAMLDTECWWEWPQWWLARVVFFLLCVVTAVLRLLATKTWQSLHICIAGHPSWLFPLTFLPTLSQVKTSPCEYIYIGLGTETFWGAPAGVAKFSLYVLEIHLLQCIILAMHCKFMSRKTKIGQSSIWIAYPFQSMRTFNWFQTCQSPI